MKELSAVLDCPLVSFLLKSKNIKGNQLARYESISAIWPLLNISWKISL